MIVSGRRKIARIAVAVFLTLAPVVWAQQTEQAPLSLTGNLGVGISDVQDARFSRTGPVASADSDLSGYWRDPRILLYDFSPYIGFGNSFANGLEIANRGKGFNSTTTFLGGSPFPLTVTYSRLWQDIPTYSSNGDVLSGLSTSLSSSTLGIDTGVYWGKLPPISLHYGRGNVNTDYAGTSGTSQNAYNNLVVGTYYNVGGWKLDGSYDLNHTDALRPDLLNFAGPLQSETFDTRDLHLEARGQSWLMSETIVGGEKKWADDAPGTQIDTTYRYVHGTCNAHPFSRLNLNFNTGYDSNEAASAIQELLGVQGASPLQGVILPGVAATMLNSSNITVGGGAQLILPKGFSVSGNTSAGQFSSSVSPVGKTMVWDASLDYLRRMKHRGSLTASYGYQHAEASGSTLGGEADTKTLRAGISSMVPYKVFFSGSMHYDQRDLKSNTVSSGRVNSLGNNYGFVLSGTRPVTDRLKLSVDFDYNDGTTEYPVYFESKTKTLGVRAESPSWQLSLHRNYQQGLAMQVGNGVVFVSDSQQALLTPLGSALSMNSNVQTVLTGTYQPGRKRLRVAGSWIQFSYDNRGQHVTDASLYNFVVSYRLRLLRLQAGFYRSTSQAFTGRNLSPLVRRQIYFEVIRHFNLF